MPQLEAAASERAIISAILTGVIQFRDLPLTLEDFTEMTCIAIWQIMETVNARGQDCTLVNVIDAVQGRNPTEAAILDLACNHQIIVSNVLAKQYISNIKRATLRRALIRQQCEAIKLLKDEKQDPMQVASALREQTGELMKIGPAPLTRKVSDIFMELFAKIEKGNKEVSLDTGLTELNRILNGGIRGSKFVVIGARPGVGKSHFALWLADKAAMEGKRVLYVTMEMGAEEVTARLIAKHAMVDSRKFESQDFTKEEKMQIAEDAKVFNTLQIEIADEINTPAEMRMRANEMRSRKGLDLIVVDYLGLMVSGQNFNGNRVQEVSTISRELKKMTQEYKIPVIALTQFNRDSVKGGGTRMPTMAEARDSGSIEQDANVFIILHEPNREETEKNDKTGMLTQCFDLCDGKTSKLVILSVAKNRSGITGMFPMQCFTQYSLFRQFYDDLPPDESYESIENVMREDADEGQGSYERNRNQSGGKET